MEQIHITPMGEVHLTLPETKKYKRWRTLGVIKGDTFFTRRCDTNGMMRNNHEIAFNYEVVRYGPFRYVEVHFFPSGRLVRTERQTILDYGQIMHLKKNDLDKQIYIKMADVDKPPKPHKSSVKAGGPRVIQGSLFDESTNMPTTMIAN